MRRKLIQLAGKTLVVSLPNKWVQKYGLKKGDEIELEETENKLILSQNNEIINEKIEINISGMKEIARRLIGSAYKTGYDEILIRFESTEELDITLKVIKDELSGFEITKRTNDTITIKNVAAINYAEFETILRRIFLVILSMIEDSCGATYKNDKNMLEMIIAADTDINRYTDFCRRILNKKGYFQFRKTPPLYYIIEQLEKTADSIRDLCIVAKTETLSKDEIKILEEIAAFIRQFYDLYYKYENKKMNEFTKKRIYLKNKILNLTEKNKTKTQLYSIVDNCYDMNGALMAINF